MATVKKAVKKAMAKRPMAKKPMQAPPMMQAPPTASAPMGGGPMMKKGGKMKKYKSGGVLSPFKNAVSKNIGNLNKAKDGGSFPDLNKDGKISKADVLVGRGVIKAKAKAGAKMKMGGKCKNGC